MERETGIGPATNSLEGCDSTTELLPLTAGAEADALTTKCLELTERLELSTSPLPRECSTTELRQPYKFLKLKTICQNSFALTILPRTQPSEYDTEGKKS
jgi:hypothetical protein